MTIKSNGATEVITVELAQGQLDLVHDFRRREGLSLDEALGRLIELGLRAVEGRRK